MKFVWLLCGLISWGFCAPSKTVEVIAKVDHAEITVGDQLHYEIEVTFPDSGKVELPSVLGNLGAFEVKDYQVQNGKSADGRNTITHAFVLSTFTVGPYTLPPQEVNFRKQGDSMAMVLHTQPTAIQVKRTSPETVKDIADIADVLDLPEPWPWAATSFGLLFFGGVGYFIWRRFGRKPIVDTLAPPLLPPFEEAMEKMAALNAAQLLRQNKARELGFALSEVLRNYIGRVFDIDALESTTPEFLEKCKPLTILPMQKEWLKNCCDALDQIKYASSGILETEATRVMQELRDFFMSTKPTQVLEKK